MAPPLMEAECQMSRIGCSDLKHTTCVTEPRHVNSALAHEVLGLTCSSLPPFHKIVLAVYEQACRDDVTAAHTHAVAPGIGKFDLLKVQGHGSVRRMVLSVSALRPRSLGSKVRN